MLLHMLFVPVSVSCTRFKVDTSTESLATVASSISGNLGPSSSTVVFFSPSVTKTFNQTIYHSEYSIETLHQKQTQHYHLASVSFSFHQHVLASSYSQLELNTIFLLQ